MQISESNLSPYHGDLVGFSGERVNVIGVVELRTTFRTELNVKTIDARYLVIDSRALYHMILGRPSLNTLGAVVSTRHLVLKFPFSPTKVRVMHTDKKEARQCYNESLKKKGKEQGKAGTQEIHMVDVDRSRKMNMMNLDPREEGKVRLKPNNELHKIQIGATPEKFTFIGRELPKAMKAKLIELLRENSNLFAWALEDMLGINPRIIYHKLAIDSKVRPMSQKKRKLGMEK